jgi:hypothetical protein
MDFHLSTRTGALPLRRGEKTDLPRRSSFPALATGDLNSPQVHEFRVITRDPYHHLPTPLPTFSPHFHLSTPPSPPMAPSSFPIGTSPAQGTKSRTRLAPPRPMAPSRFLPGTYLAKGTWLRTRLAPPPPRAPSRFTRLAPPPTRAPSLVPQRRILPRYIPAAASKRSACRLTTVSPSLVPPRDTKKPLTP